MKALILVVVATIGSFAGKAQQTIQFTSVLSGTNAVPPSGTILTGRGEFSVAGNELWSRVRVQSCIGLSAEIRGPAESGRNGPALFGLLMGGCEAPLPPVLPYGESTYVLRTNLTESQLIY